MIPLIFAAAALVATPIDATTNYLLLQQLHEQQRARQEADQQQFEDRWYSHRHGYHDDRAYPTEDEGDDDDDGD